MAEPTQFMFKHRDLVIAMVKAQGLHEGLWQLSVTFGFGAANVGPTSDEVTPAAIIPLQAIGLQRVEKLENTSISVDASVVNPKPQGA